MRTTYIAIGAAFLAIGLGGQTVFLILGLVFLATGVASSVKKRKGNGGPE